MVTFDKNQLPKTPTLQHIPDISPCASACSVELMANFFPLKSAKQCGAFCLDYLSAHFCWFHSLSGLLKVGSYFWKEICWRFVFIFPLLSKAAATNWQINQYQSIQIPKKLLLINQGLFCAWRHQLGFCWSCLKMSCHFHPSSHFLEMWTDSWTRFWSESQSTVDCQIGTKGDNNKNPRCFGLEGV